MSIGERIHLALANVASDIKTVLTAASASLIFVGTVSIPFPYTRFTIVCFVSGVVGFAIRAGLDAISS